MSVSGLTRPFQWRDAGPLLLRLAPWLIFGPITGLMSEWALRSFRRGRWVRAGAIVVLNILVLTSIPLLTGLVASHALAR